MGSIEIATTRQKAQVGGLARYGTGVVEKIGVSTRVDACCVPVSAVCCGHSACWLLEMDDDVV